MIKKYIAIEHKNSKYCKGVPYISKKEFKKNKNNLIVGKTKLKNINPVLKIKIWIYYYLTTKNSK